MPKPIMGRYARIIMDDWFKRSFGTESRKRLLQLFLQELIPEHRIVNLSYTNTEHTNPIPGKKDVRIDVECLDADGTRFVVELQVAPQRYFYERAIFKSSFAIQQQKEKGEDEYDFPTVYFIGLMDFSLHEGTDRVDFRYMLRESITGELMTERVQYIFLELPNSLGIALKPEASVLQNFCYALHMMEHLTERPEELREEIFRLLFDSAEIANFAPEEKARYEQNMTTERDIRNQIAYARDKGLEEGMEKGIAQGMAQGMEKGIEKGIRLMVEQLRRLGVSEDEINKAVCEAKKS